MLNKLKKDKMLLTVSYIILLLLILIVGIPLFQISVEIISNLGRIVGSFIRTNTIC